MSNGIEILQKEALELCIHKYHSYSDKVIVNFSTLDQLMYELGRLASPKGMKEKKLYSDKKSNLQTMHVR